MADNSFDTSQIDDIRWVELTLAYCLYEKFHGTVEASNIVRTIST